MPRIDPIEMHVKNNSLWQDMWQETTPHISSVGRSWNRHDGSGGRNATAWTLKSEYHTCGDLVSMMRTLGVCCSSPGYPAARVRRMLTGRSVKMIG